MRFGSFWHAFISILDQNLSPKGSPSGCHHEGRAPAQDTEYRIQDTRYKIQDTGYKIQNKIQDTKYKIQDTGYKIKEGGSPVAAEFWADGRKHKLEKGSGVPPVPTFVDNYWRIENRTAQGGSGSS